MNHPIPTAALAQHIAILGKTGSGKTSTEKLAVEQVVADGFRVCVLDSVKSDWWGITSSADGKRPGLPFKILGGPRGHVPLHSSAGKVIGQLVGAGKLPLSIIDMADFEPGGLQRFFVDFAPALMRNARGVVYLVIEEAHEFAPKERSGIGAENMAIHWAKKLATAGRSKGIRLIVATQRIQALHNAVLGSCETVIAHRLSTPADQEPVIKWLKANVDKETQERVASSLSSLATGTGWICSGEARIFEQVAFPKFKTYDNTATPTGDGHEIAVKTASVDQDELRSIIGDAVKEAEANDPKALRVEIARLQKELKNIPQNIPEADPKVIEASEQRGFERAKQQIGGTMEAKLQESLLHVLAELRTDVGSFITKLDNDIAHVKAVRPDLKSKVTFTPSGPPPRSSPRGAPTGRAGGLPSRKPLPRTAGGKGDHPTADLSGPQQRIIDAIAWWNAVGHARPSRVQVAFVSGYKPNTGTFNTYLGALSTSGMIEYPAPGMVALTEQGAQMARAPEARPDRQELHQRVAQILSGPQMKLLAPLLDKYPDAMSRDELAAAASYQPNTGTFNTYLGSLSTLAIVEYPQRGQVAAADWLFP